MMTDSFVPGLEKLGYFEGLDPAKARSLKQVFATQGWFGIFSESHRLYCADAEELAEGGIGAFIAQLNPFLVNQGVAVPKIEDQISESGYAVSVGEIRRQIYDEADLQNEGNQMGLIWGLSTVRGFRIVDDLLTSAGSTARVYAINGGNDLSAFLLSPEMFDAIMAHADASKSQGPYKPIEDYPWFGQPHDN